MKWQIHYALSGQWHFMDVYETLDEETAAIVSLLSRAHGAYLVESWTAIPNHRLMKIAEAIEGAARTWASVE